MKILITGGSGLLGQYLNRELSGEHEILTICNHNSGNSSEYNSVKCDITDREKLSDIIRNFQPAAIIHTAAISRPETCDLEGRDKTFEVNTAATKFIAEECDRIGAKLIFTSTDLVYNGDTGGMLREDSELVPVSLYAESKASAEEAIRNTFGNYIILRTSLLYGMGLHHSRNNFHIMLENFIAGKPVRLFYDQFRTPLSLSDAARMLKELVIKDVNSAVINFGGRERMSRVDLGEMVCAIGKFDKGLIERISMDDVPGLHKVKDVSMNTELLNSFGIFQKPADESVREILKSIEGA